MEPGQTTPAAPATTPAPDAAAPAAAPAAPAPPAAAAAAAAPTPATAAASAPPAPAAAEPAAKAEPAATTPAAPAPTPPAQQGADDLSAVRAQLQQAQNELAIARAGGAGLSQRLISALAAQVKGSTPEERAADAKQLVSEITSQVRVSTRSPEDAAPPLPENPMEALREGVLRTMGKLQAI